MALNTVWRDKAWGWDENKKRPWWMLATLMPLLPIPGLLLAHFSGNQAWLYLPIAVVYLLIPALDCLFGEDTANPGENDVESLEADPYFRYVTLLSVPLLFVGFLSCVAYFLSHELSAAAYIALVILSGFVGGLALNLAHELGHAKSSLETWFARIALAPCGYGHFCIDHNRGHHRDVATPEDHASAKLGENIYQFALREIPGVFKRAWAIEALRLQRKGIAAFSWHNEILQNWAMSVAIYGTLVAMFGWSLLPFLLLQALFGYLQLTSANYVEHYGLLRKTREDGRYEVCQPRHSWNSNHRASNIILFHLERHSDHHANPTRRYQALRHFDEAPQLPNGYFGMFLAAYMPPVWRHLMDKRVLAQNGPDMGNSNVLASRRDYYQHLADKLASQAC